MVESLDGILLTAVEAFRDPEGEELAWLLRLTGDRSEMMERVRAEYLSAESGLPQDERRRSSPDGAVRAARLALPPDRPQPERWERLEKKDGGGSARRL